MNNKNSIAPPQWTLRFFRWFCNPDFAEDIEGDLLERFDKRINENKAARWKLLMDVLRLFRPGIVRSLGGTQKLNYYGMFKNHVKIAYRNALRQKQFSVLNLLGLALGVSTFLLISLYINDETSYDTFHEKGDRIYRVNQPNIWGDWNEMMPDTGPNVAVALREDAPDFEIVTRLLALGYLTVTTNQDGNPTHVFKENRIYAAEENFF